MAIDPTLVGRAAISLPWEFANWLRSMGKDPDQMSEDELRGLMFQGQDVPMDFQTPPFSGQDVPNERQVPPGPWPEFTGTPSPLEELLSGAPEVVSPTVAESLTDEPVPPQQEAMSAEPTLRRPDTGGVRGLNSMQSASQLPAELQEYIRAQGVRPEELRRRDLAGIFGGPDEAGMVSLPEDLQDLPDLLKSEFQKILSASVYEGLRDAQETPISAELQELAKGFDSPVPGTRGYIQWGDGPRVYHTEESRAAKDEIARLTGRSMTVSAGDNVALLPGGKGYVIAHDARSETESAIEARLTPQQRALRNQRLGRSPIHPDYGHFIEQAGAEVQNLFQGGGTAQEMMSGLTTITNQTQGVAAQRRAELRSQAETKYNIEADRERLRRLRTAMVNDPNYGAAGGRISDAVKDAQNYLASREQLVQTEVSRLEASDPALAQLENLTARANQGVQQLMQYELGQQATAATRQHTQMQQTLAAEQEQRRLRAEVPDEVVSNYIAAKDREPAAQGTEEFDAVRLEVAGLPASSRAVYAAPVNQLASLLVVPETRAETENRLKPLEQDFIQRVRPGLSPQRAVIEGNARVATAASIASGGWREFVERPEFKSLMSEQEHQRLVGDLDGMAGLMRASGLQAEAQRDAMQTVINTYFTRSDTGEFLQNGQAWLQIPSDLPTPRLVNHLAESGREINLDSVMTALTELLAPEQPDTLVGRISQPGSTRSQTVAKWTNEALPLFSEFQEWLSALALDLPASGLGGVTPSSIHAPVMERLLRTQAEYLKATERSLGTPNFGSMFQ